MTSPFADPEVFAETFHTGLRKGCDGHWSTLAWHLVRQSDGYGSRGWADFCQFVSDEFRNGLDISPGFAWSNFSNACLGWDWRRVQGRSWALMWWSALRLADKSDWQTLIIWFQYCQEVMEGAKATGEADAETPAPGKATDA